MSTFCRGLYPNPFREWILALSDGVIPTKWFGDFALEDVPVGNVRGGQRHPEIFIEGVDEILRKREPHKGINPDELFVLK